MRERRKFVRVISNIVLRYYILDPIEFATARTYDVGGGGIRFVTDEGLPKDTVLDLEIDLPESARTIRAKSRVVWASDLGNGYWEVATEFIEIDNRDRDKVLKHVYFSYRGSDT